MAGKKIETILVLIAMEAEAKPLIDGLGLEKDEPSLIPPPAPAVTFSGSKGSAKVHVACNGKCAIHGVDNVGTVPAALTAYLAIQQLKPDIIISAGTAGGFKAKGGAIGDVYVATGFANHDRHIPIPGFDKYGIWRYDATPTPNLKKALGLKEGIVSSSNSLTYSDADMAQMLENGASVKEMEAAGISWAGHLFNTPFFAIKSITDIVDGDRPPQEEFLENLQTAAKALHDTLGPVLDFVAGKSVEEL